MRNNVKTTVLAIVGILLLASPGQADEGGRGLGTFGDFGGFGPGGVHFAERAGGFGGLGLFGAHWGLGFFDVDRIQTRFESQFDTLQTQYDEGVGGGADFFSSEEYDRIVHKTERLDDRYGLFVGGVERGIDRLGDLIMNTNDDITFFGDLLANYQSDPDISPSRLERIELFINRITDRLNQRVDTLTEKQTTLQTNLPTYQSFQTDVSTFLSDIVAAGGGTSNSTLSVSALLAAPIALPGAVASDIAVPEPAAVALFAIGAIPLSTAVRFRRGR
jgi:hypothetical protein